MSTDAQITANQANAKLSTGPTTEEGKEVCSMNAMKHGIRSLKLLLQGDDPAELESLREALYHELNPEGTEEKFCVDQMIAAKWKLRRVEDAEHRVLSKNPDALLDGSIEKLHRYEAQLTRAFFKASRELVRLKKDMRVEAARERRCAKEEFEAYMKRLSTPPSMRSSKPEPEPDSDPQPTGDTSFLSEAERTILNSYAEKVRARQKAALETMANAAASIDERDAA